jgi:hypothetical protein
MLQTCSTYAQTERIGTTPAESALDSRKNTMSYPIHRVRRRVHVLALRSMRPNRISRRGAFVSKQDLNTSTAGRNAAFAFSTFRASGIRHQSACSLGFQPTVLFSQNKPATSNQPPVLFSQNKPAPAISHQPTEQAECLPATAYRQQPADRQKTHKKKHRISLKNLLGAIASHWPWRSRS